MGLLKDVRLQRICHFKNTELTRLVTFPKAISDCSLCFFLFLYPVMCFLGDFQRVKNMYNRDKVWSYCQDKILDYRMLTKLLFNYN